VPVPTVVTSKARSNSPPVTQSTVSFKGWPPGSHDPVNHYQRLTELSRRALHLHDKNVDRDPAAHAESLTVCGDALRHAGKLPEAKAHLSEALALQRRRLGATDPSLGQTLYQFAIVEKMLGETDAANANFEEGIAILAERYAQDAQARAYVGLARAIWNLGPPSAVEHVLHSALKFHLKSGIPLPLTDLANAIKIPVNDLYAEALRIEIPNLGPAHPAVQRLGKSAVSVMMTMEDSSRKLGRTEDALKLQGEIQAMRTALKFPAEVKPVLVPTTDNRRRVRVIRDPK
jgi:tetratricopeptide (TPR) repeat protein